ncbi:MAG: DegV family protein [Christensenellaceae bacterium]
MEKYILSCCSTADLTKEHFDKRNIRYICFHYYLGETEYPDDLGETVSFDDFYARMEAGEPTRTSQVNVEEFVEYFTPFLEQGLDIVHVCLSSGISGVYNWLPRRRPCSRKSSRAENLYRRFSRRVLGYGLFMDKLADLRDEGMEIAELVTWAEDHKLNVHHWFSPPTSNITCGGRISKASGFIGTL